MKLEIRPLVAIFAVVVILGIRNVRSSVVVTTQRSRGSTADTVSSKNFTIEGVALPETQAATDRTVSRSPNDGWSAETMPDPRSCPSCCGLTKPGWLCDPDGVFSNKAFGGEPGLAERTNELLWNVMNASVCACEMGSCGIYGARVFVVVVEKLKNPENKPPRILIVEFAKDLLKKFWRTGDAACQVDVIMALSVYDGVITTEIGCDILTSAMMTYADVELVGGYSQRMHGASDLFNTIHLMIRVYGMYLDHLPDATVAPDASFGNCSVIDDLDEPGKGSGLQPTAIGLIVAAVVLFFVAIAIGVLIPCVCRKGKLCHKREK